MPDVYALQSAVELYKMIYGQLPGDQGEDVRLGPECPSKYDALIELLSCSDVDGDGEVAGNRRGIRMIEVDWPEGGTLTDRWQKRFVIRLDLGSDGRIVLGDIQVSASVVVYSFGPNGSDDMGKNDDVCYWR